MHSVLVAYTGVQDNRDKPPWFQLGRRLALATLVNRTQQVA